MLSRIKNLIVLVAVPASFAVAGCGGSGSVESPPATADTAVTKAPVAQNAQGPVKMIGLALGDVPLTSTQRAEIEKLAADCDARHTATKQVRQDLANAVAVQVEAGTIDRAALQPKIDAVAAAWESTRPADRAAFERLHAILDANQRTAFVNALEAKVAERAAAHNGKNEMQAWAADLQLTDDQKQQIKDAFRAKFQAMRAEHGDHADHADHHGQNGEFAHAKEQHKQMLEAFKADRFVMDEVAPKVDAKVATTKFATHMLGMVETVVPILTPQQRTIAAQKIRTQAATAHHLEL